MNEASQLGVQEDAAGGHGPRKVASARPPADDARLRHTVETHFDCVWRTLRRLGVAPAAADDAAQQVFIVAARRLREIRAGEERSYLLGVALRVASDARRAGLRRKEVSLEEADGVTADETDAADALVDEKRARERLHGVLDGLPARQREAFVLFELEELGASQVAALLGIPMGTVASRVRHARIAIRKALASRRGSHE